MAEWNEQGVADHFNEAVRTLRQLPPVRARGYFSVWSEVPRTAKEIAAMELEPTPVRPGPDAITRLEQTFEWMLWITVQERELLWLRAARVPWKAIAWEFGCDRTTAWRRWTLALAKIASRLNAGKEQCVATLFLSTSATSLGYLDGRLAKPVN